DVLADVHIGRLTATSASELGIVVNKIVGYESNPWLTNDTEWFLRAGLTGDPSSSGYSTIWVNQWVKEQLQQMNYARIDTIWSGNFVTQMMATVSAGESIFTYRGYWNMSGLNTGYIAAMSNQQKLPYAVIMTCDTGSFWTDQTARSEAFLRAPSGGGVAAIGTATIGTHTRYNNCMFQGTLENVLNSGDNRVGPSLTRGKLNMYANYFAPEPERVTIWSTWNNLMGDPATSIWTAVPRALTVDAPAALDGNATAVPVVVTADGQPVEGAIVAAYRKNTYTGNAVTGADGRVVLPIDGLADGVLYLTVTGRNLQPWQGEITIGTVALSLDRVAVVVDDDMNGGSSGDGDGIAEPGETVELWVTVGNGGTDPAVDVTATLASPDADAVVVQDAVTYGAIAAGGSAPGGTSFVVSLAPALAGGRELSLELTASDQGQAFTGLVTLAIAGPAASVAGAVPGTGVLNPGETGALAITLANGGDRDLAGATALLSSNDPWVTVLDGSGVWGAIPVGGSAANGADGFSVSVGSDCVPGHLAVLQLDVTYASGGTASLPVAVTFGAATPTDPTGPDAYGYYAFDDTDAAWTQAPVYDWVEIDPAAGGSGTFLGLTDYAIYSDDTRTVDLPFAFRYYGQDFAKISICSNGWFSFGTTYQRHYRNRTLPAPGTPDNLVAVYWDEVYQVSGDGGVFTWYDAANHRYVIEWRRMRNEVSAALETFQAVLYDPAYGAGDTGDGMILMQYQTVNAVDSTEGYATVGIQDEALGDAVLYTYWNAYTPGSTPIAAGRAILFTTFEAQVQGQLLGTVTNASAGGAPLPGAVVSVVGAGRSLMTAANGAYAGGVPVG
ncbi:MAG TPA: C25 family cysteine peptidase, partial [Candidatus Krumholzibacteria bacterium]|nr:C25 family cysteine peptidase [Candidatus Krumholzibacteria bacterium]